MQLGVRLSLVSDQSFSYPHSWSWVVTHYDKLSRTFVAASALVGALCRIKMLVYIMVIRLSNRFRLPI